jgi:hypothetical protein
MPPDVPAWAQQGLWAPPPFVDLVSVDKKTAAIRFLSLFSMQFMFEWMK